MPADLDALENAADTCFGNRDFLIRALTHTSHAYEKGQQPLNDNEQLEFLGDAVLGFLISECLVKSYPAYREGRLSIIKNYLVSASHLHEAAQKLELGEYLLLGRGEELSGGRVRRDFLPTRRGADRRHLPGRRHRGGTRIRGAACFRDGAEHEPGAETPFTNSRGAAGNRPLARPAVAEVLDPLGARPAHAGGSPSRCASGESGGAAEGDSKKAAGQMAARACSSS